MADLKILQKRAGLLQAVRLFFIEQGFFEVETPVRVATCAPEAHIEPEVSGEYFLQTSPELAMKRLLAQGAEKIFQLCRCFRRGERGDQHLPEFTMLEWYRTNSDYRDLMADCEGLLQFLARVLPEEAAELNISFAPPWERLTVAQAFDRYAKIPLAKALADDLFEEILCRDIEPNLGKIRPTILYDYPAALGSLARLSAKNPAVAERFEFYINGLEIANGFSELIDPQEQRQRFEQDREQIKKQGREPGPMPESFLADLKKMPEAAGIALGIDRLAMVFFKATRIDEVVAFPPETKQPGKPKA